MIKQDNLEVVPLSASTPAAAVAGVTVEDEERLCRICLEDDEPDTMISPCMCRGTSKWVHRSCLDQWRIHERDRAFSQCTECNFTYHMEAKGGRDHEVMWRHAKFYMLVSRDILLVTLALQAVISFFGWIVYRIDTNDDIVDLLNGSHQHCSNDNTGAFFWCNHVTSVYYLCGLFTTFIILGFYGCIILSSHRCSVGAALEHIQQTTAVSNGNDENPTASQECAADASSCLGSNDDCSNRDIPSNSSQEQRPHYRPHYRQHMRSRDRGRGGYYGGGYYYPYYYPYYNGGYYGGAGPDCCYCPDCRCCDGGCPHIGGSGGSNSSSGGNNNNSSDCNGDAMHILLLILLVVAIIMAVVGFLVGLVIAVVVGQRIVQRHVFLLQKQRLVREFIVKDLEDYGGGIIPSAPVDRGFDDEPSSKDCSTENLSYGGVDLSPPPQALHRKDVQHLKKLGLMD